METHVNLNPEEWLDTPIYIVYNRYEKMIFGIYGTYEKAMSVSNDLNALERYKNYIVYKKLARELLLECLRSRYNDRNPFKNESMWAIENGYM